jgi:hypothetical protein
MNIQLGVGSGTLARHADKPIHLDSVNIDRSGTSTTSTVCSATIDGYHFGEETYPGYEEVRSRVIDKLGAVDGMTAELLRPAAKAELPSALHAEGRPSRATKSPPLWRASLTSG